MNKTDKKIRLETKKLTLKAWTMILYRQGRLSLEKCNRMIAMIEKLVA